MTGMGFVRMLFEVFKRFINTYIVDLRRGKSRYYTPEGIEERRAPDVEGIFTIQYPEEKAPVPEEFRYLPFLVYDEGLNGEKEIRCTSCGICAKVCPPQCIWIVRTNDPQTGRPIPQPKEFYIDVDICMNCGFCAEYCPFDAIKMDHEYEIASYSREGNVYNLERLLKPVSYYASIRPKNNAAEIAARMEKEAQKAAARNPAGGVTTG